MLIAAIVPAAGRSERMGRPKLVLPIDGRPLIERVVHALRAGGAGVVVVVVPPATEPGANALADAARNAGAEVVVAPTTPPDMRGSVALGIDHLNRREGNVPTTLLINPGDSPGLTADLVARVVARARQDPEAIVVPVARDDEAIPWRCPGP